MSLPSGSAAAFDNLEAQAMSTVTTKRLTTKQKLANQKEEERRKGKVAGMNNSR